MEAAASISLPAAAQRQAPRLPPPWHHRLARWARVLSLSPAGTPGHGPACMPVAEHSASVLCLVMQTAGMTRLSPAPWRHLRPWPSWLAPCCRWGGHWAANTHTLGAQTCPEINSGELPSALCRPCPPVHCAPLSSLSHLVVRTPPQCCKQVLPEVTPEQQAARHVMVPSQHQAASFTAACRCGVPSYMPGAPTPAHARGRLQRCLLLSPARA